MMQIDTLREVCTALADAVMQLAVALERADEAAAPPPRDADGARNCNQVESDAVLPIPAPCLDPAVQARPDAGDAAAPGSRLFVYVAGARGLAELTRTRGSSIMAALGLAQLPYVVKVGTTTTALEARLRQVGQDRYGAAVRAPDGSVFIEAGFTRWVAHAVAPSREPRDLAVALLPRAIRVDLPAGLTRRAFDAALHCALQARALDGLPASVLPKRYVAYDLVATRLNAAQELYALSPHLPADCDLLLRAVEGILRRHGRDGFKRRASPRHHPGPARETAAASRRLRRVPRAR